MHNEKRLAALAKIPDQQHREDNSRAVARSFDDEMKTAQDLLFPSC
jgi:hypothetical protein